MKLNSAHSKAIAFYGMTLILTKLMSLIALPLITGSIPPSEFGKLELIISLIECAGLLCGLAITEVFNRIAAHQDKRQSLYGTVILLSLINFTLLQTLVYFFTPVDFINPSWLHASMVTASLGAMIELPLAQLRFYGKIGQFSCYLIGRAIAQLILQYLFLQKGFGAGSIIFANVIIEIVICALLFMSFLKLDKRVLFNKESYALIHKFSLPYICGALFMYTVGNADRFFLVSYVSLEQIAFYGIALKFAYFISLFSHAFHHWYGPKKHALYESENGHIKTRQIMGLGLLILFTGALFLSLTVPTFVTWLLPPSYHEMTRYFIPLLFVILLNDISTLTVFGAYRAKSGYIIFKINGFTAFLALCGYYFLIPLYGIYGAILATFIAQFIRNLILLRELYRNTDVLSFSVAIPRQVKGI